MPDFGPLIQKKYDKAYKSVPSGTACPKCGNPLYWNQRRTAERCVATNPNDPFRQCDYAILHVPNYHDR